jgi:hypothetical protein
MKATDMLRAGHHYCPTSCAVRRHLNARGLGCARPDWTGQRGSQPFPERLSGRRRDLRYALYEQQQNRRAEGRGREFFPGAGNLQPALKLYGGDAFTGRIYEDEDQRRIDPPRHQ